MHLLKLLILVAATISIAACGSDSGKTKSPKEGTVTMTDTKDMEGLETATLGAGCYWCVEAVLQQVDGVIACQSGFMGGQVDNPSYEAVCSGSTGHAEVVQVTFDPKKISYDGILSWFWKLHDPTTLNRQGGDSGTQYRSAIYFHSDRQRETAEKSKAAAAKDFSDPIVTEVTKASIFYKAKESHQDYYRQNKKSNSYCPYVIKPKLKKLGLDY